MRRLAALPLVLVAVACGASEPSAITDGAPITGDGGQDDAATGAADAGGSPTSDAGMTVKPTDAGDASAQADATAAVTAASLLALTKTCKTKISTSPYAPDVGAPATIDVCGLTGAVFFTADMDIDCDGKPSATCSKATDPSFQPDTAAQASTGGALDAAILPYIVLPGTSSRWSYTASGIAMGSVAAVIYNGKVQFGIVGDVGPTSIIGEASYAMAKSLGIPSNPSTGGVDSGVTYIVFTGKGAMVKKNEDAAEAVTLGNTSAQALLANN